jgi:PPK2 family polyphosphate:nucleotide phosphotransferase
MARIDSKDYRIRPGHAVDLRKRPTRVPAVYKSKEDYQALLQKHIQGLSSQQNRLYALNRHALLVIFQAMDAAGKDSMVRHVMSGVNPQGCQVFSFKHPGPEELQHDFLWSATRHLPERGRIGIFNRSYYEEVLIVRVHPEILEAEQIPAEDLGDREIWEHRFQSILNLERHLYRSGTHIVKFFLHISKEEQRKRFLARIDDPDKNWKLSMADIEERQYWKQYMRAYEACLAATSTHHAPWYAVPADDKLNAQLIVSEIILETLSKLKLDYPKTDSKRRRELRGIRAKLTK